MVIFSVWPSVSRGIDRVTLSSISNMNHQFLLSVALAISGASSALGQAATSSSDPLGEFLGTLSSAVDVISSANAKATAASGSSSSSPATTSASPTSQAPVASSSSAPAQHGLSSHNKLIIAIVCAIVGVLLLAAILGLCCCLCYRRRLHRKERKMAARDNEKAHIHPTPAGPLNPGRTYTPLNQHGHTSSMETQPRVPLAAAAAQSDIQHPAHRQQNPFVPVPPSPRKGAYSSGGLTDTTAHDPYVAGPHESYDAMTNHHKSYNTTGPHDSYSTGPHDSYATAPLIAETQPLRLSTQQPRSRSNSRPSSTVLPKSATADRPSTPFGLTGIGQPYEDMHVHVLQTERPSRELQQSLQNREPIQRYHTPPLIPSRSPHRRSNVFADSSYQSNSSSNTNSGSGDDWRRSQVGPGAQTATVPPWEQRQNRYSNRAANAGLPAPPVPWDDQSDPQRRHSGNGSSSSSGDGNGNVPHDRRGSRSPATSINGQPRRLRFSDLQAPETGTGTGTGPLPHANTNSNSNAHYDAWDDRYQYSQGVGEAL